MTSESRPSSHQTKEIPLLSEVGVFDELDPLRRVAIWGEPGPETALAKILPHEKSLFYDDMNVMRARDEITTYTGILEDNGVEVLHVRDYIADTAKVPDMSVDEIKKALVQRGFEILRDHPVEKYPEQKGKEIKFEAEVEALFDQDVSKYGEDKAKALAKALSLNGQLPLGNSLYARDQMNVLGEQMVISSMKEPIRQPEVPYFKEFYKTRGVSKIIELPEGSEFSFEGGDAYIVDGVVYMGVAYRTSEEAAKFIYGKLAKELKDNGFKFAMVVNDKVKSLPHEERQKIMHIDTWSFFFGDRQVLLLPNEAANRSVVILEQDANGNIIENPQGNYIDYLLKQGYVVHYVSSEEQKEFACNNIALDKKTIIVPIETNQESIKTLEKAGQKVIKVDLFNITRGYGAAHCITGTLLRSK